MKANPKAIIAAPAQQLPAHLIGVPKDIWKIIFGYAYPDIWMTLPPQLFDRLSHRSKILLPRFLFSDFIYKCIQLNTEFPTVLQWNENLHRRRAKIYNKVLFSADKYDRCGDDWYADTANDQVFAFITRPKAKVRKLFSLAANGDLAGIIDLQVDASFLIYRRRKDGFTPLHIAAYNGHSQVVEWMLTQKHRDIRLCFAGCNALYYAVANRHRNTVIKFLETSIGREMIFHAWHYFGITPYFMALENDMEDLFSPYVAANPKILGKFREITINSTRNTLEKRLTLAAIAVGAKRMFAKYVNPENLVGLKYFRYMKVNSALMLAAISDQRNLVKQLLSLGEPPLISEAEIRASHCEEQSITLDDIPDLAIKVLLHFRLIADEGDSFARQKNFQALIEFSIFADAAQSARKLRLYTAGLQLLIQELKAGEHFGVSATICQEFLYLAENRDVGKHIWNKIFSYVYPEAAVLLPLPLFNDWSSERVITYFFSDEFFARMKIQREFPTALRWDEYIWTDFYSLSRKHKARPGEEFKPEISVLSRYDMCVKVNYGVFIHDKKMRAIFYHIANWTASAIPLVIALSALINEQRNSDGFTPLHLAAFIGNTAAVEVILSLNPDVSLFCYAGLTALYYAVRNGHRDTAQVMLSNESVSESINATAHCCGITPYFIAFETNLMELFAGREEVRLRKKSLTVSPAQPNVHGAVAAIAIGAKRWLTKLLPGLPEFTVSYGNWHFTPLGFAARCDNRQMVKTFLKSGASPWSARYAALTSGDIDYVSSASHLCSDLITRYYLLFAECSCYASEERLQYFTWLIELAPIRVDQKLDSDKTTIKLDNYGDLAARAAAFKALLEELKAGETFGVSGEIIQEFLALAEARAQKRSLNLELPGTDFQIIETLPESLPECLEIAKNPASTAVRRAEVFAELGHRFLQQPRFATQYNLMASLYDDAVNVDLKNRYPEFSLQTPFYYSALRNIESCESQLKITDLFFVINEIYLYLFQNKDRKSIIGNAEEIKQHHQQSDFLKLLSIILDPTQSFDDFMNHIIHSNHQFQSKPVKFFKRVDGYHDARQELVVAFFRTEDDMTYLRIAAKIFQQYFMAQRRVESSFPQELSLRHEAEVERMVIIQHSLAIHVASA